MTDQVLERFHRALIEEIQTQRPEYLTQPFTVAEIYQNLVPYGSHRDRIGVEMNGDYEDALVRLLAGEGGYLILDSEPALESLRAELDGPSPNTGVYREYAAVDVRLNQAYLDLSAEAMDELPDLYEELEAEDPVTMAELAPAEGNATADDVGVIPPGVDIFGDGGPSSMAEGPAVTEAEEEPEIEMGVETGTEAPDVEEPGGADREDRAPAAGAAPDADDGAGAESGPMSVEGAASERRRPPLAPEFVEPPEEVESDGAAESGGPAESVEPAEPGRRRGSEPGGTCLWCRGDLPERESLNFCPFCGTDVNLVPCPECGDEVQPQWLFCASCGTEVGS